MENRIPVIVVGCGNMGSSHALAYQRLPGFEIAALVSRSPESRNKLSEKLGGYPTYSTLQEALQNVKAKAVSVNTYPDSHGPLVKEALTAGCHVFVEKPIALTPEEAWDLVSLATEKKLKLVVGYILRVHPSWKRFIELAGSLGKPLVMRMNLNQQSTGPQWYTHQQLMQSMSPIVDCGVHYVDVMCQMTASRPVSVSAIGARLSDEISPEMYNYGQLQVRFEDGSVGWYEAGWGPMISTNAHFIKDVIGPRGAVSMEDLPKKATDDLQGHTQTGVLRLHLSDTNPQGDFSKADELYPMQDEPTHQQLCEMEQSFFYDAITKDLNLSDHLTDAVNSLRIVLAADRSIREGKTIYLD